MNNVYENNMRFLPILKFWDKYKKIISLLVLTLIGLITFFIINKQINKYQSEQAALIYNDWQTELLSEEPNIENLNSLLDEFLKSYNKTNNNKSQIQSLAKKNKIKCLPYHPSILKKERPDAILPTVGGQTALNVAMKLD